MKRANIKDLAIRFWDKKKKVIISNLWYNKKCWNSFEEILQIMCVILITIFYVSYLMDIFLISHKLNLSQIYILSNKYVYSRHFLNMLLYQKCCCLRYRQRLIECNKNSIIEWKGCNERLYFDMKFHGLYARYILLYL